GCLDAVQERHCHAGRLEQGAEARQRRRQLPRLDGDDESLRGRQIGRRVRGVDAGGDGALRRLDADPVLADRAEMLPAGKERDLRSSPGEESREEHDVAKWLLSEIDKLDEDDERFEAKVSVLIESVKHHVKEEEGALFRYVRRLFSRDELITLGRMMAKAKKVAPTRPHPRAP